MWDSINLWTIIVAMALLFIVEARSRRLRFKEMFNAAKFSRPLQPLDEWARILAVGVGLTSLGCGVTLLAVAIEANVWDGDSISGILLLWIYVSIFQGLEALGMVVRDYRLIHGLGSNPLRHLTSGQIASIRSELECHDFRAAIVRYREAVADAGSAEAKEYVVRLFGQLRAAFPDRFAPPPLSLATLNWRAMAICTLIQAGVLGALWFVLPPAHPASAISRFTYSFMFGLGLSAGLRVKGVWKRLLLLVPAFAVAFLGEVIVPRVFGASSISLGLYWLGIFSGVCLMFSGFNPRRNRT